MTLPDGKTVALAPACLPHPAEFHRHHDPAAGERAMRRLSERTKGRVRTSFDDIWDDLPAVRTTVPLAPWIYTFAAFAFLASVFVRRLGLSGTWHFRLPRRECKARRCAARQHDGRGPRPRKARPQVDLPPTRLKHFHRKRYHRRHREDAEERKLEGQAPRKAHFPRGLRFSPPSALTAALPAAWRYPSRRGWHRK